MLGGSWVPGTWFYSHIGPDSSLSQERYSAPSPSPAESHQLAKAIKTELDETDVDSSNETQLWLILDAVRSSIDADAFRRVCSGLVGGEDSRSSALAEEVRDLGHAFRSPRTRP